MRNKTLAVTIGFLILFASAAPGQTGTDVYWRIDPGVKSCSMNIDPSLTQAQWREFTKQVGLIASYKSLASARTLGTMKFRVGLEYGSTPVNQHSPTWINTFVHPDADCPLGDAVVIPTLRGAIGISENIDIGAYWTTAPDANYGLVGGEFKYAFLRETESLPAAAVRASAAFLTGVADFNLNIYSIDLLASKEIATLIPYVGFRTSLVVGTETTSKVSLSRETVPVAQGYAGIAYTIWMINLAAEYNVATVNTFTFTLGVGF